MIPSDRRIEIVFLCDGQYVPNPVEQGKVNFHLGLSVGTNYDRAIPMKYIERLGEVVAPGIRPMWYLDMDQWTWTRRFNEKFIRSTLFSHVSVISMLCGPHIANVIDFCLLFQRNTNPLRLNQT